MIKLVAALKRKPGIDRDQLFETWETIRAPNVVRTLDPARYRLTFFSGQMGGGDPPYDGMACLWYPSLDELDAGMARAVPDELNELILPDDSFVLTTSEIVALDGAVDRDSAKATFFVKRQDGVDEAAHFAHWREQHLPNVKAALARNPGGRRYVVSLADQGRPGPYSGVAELYWTDAKAMRAGLPGREADGFREISEPYAGIIGSEVAIVG